MTHLGINSSCAGGGIDQPPLAPRVDGFVSARYMGSLRRFTLLCDSDGVKRRYG